MKKITISNTFFILTTLCACSSNSSLTLSKIENGINIHQEHQSQYLLDDNPSNIGKYSAYASLEKYANPIPVTFKWKGGKAPYKLNISEVDNPDSSFVFETNSKSLDVYNLKVKTKYNWTVTFDELSQEINSFETTGQSLRNIFVDGVDNFRDLGGYLTSSGKLVKQGLIYRSAEINKNKDMSGTLLATQDGIDTLKNQLNIKTEIDLRKNVLSDGVSENGGIDKSPIDASINYINLPMYYDGENMLAHSDVEKNAVNHESIKSFFKTLTNKDNYPIVFHCVQGKDRTGMLSYILGALLGVEKNDLYRDYLFTNFSKSVGSACKITDIDNKYGLTISKCDGETLQEKTRNYLKTEYLFSDDQLDSIVNILL